MLKDLKKILQKIQVDRAEELSEEIDVYKERQESLLKLELPYSTKAGDMFLPQAEAASVRDAKKRAKVHSFSKTFVDEWIKSDPKDVEKREVFCDFLHRYVSFGFYQHTEGEKPIKLSVQDLISRFSLDFVIDKIKTAPIAVSLKTEYEKQAADLYAFLDKDIESPLTFRHKGPISSSELCKLFEYLEKRALKSTAVRSFYDILLCRALFYAPLSAKKLFDLDVPQKKGERYYLISDGQEFPVPRSFVELWKAFKLKDALFPYAFDEDLLSRKIRRLGEYAKINSLLSISVLKMSQQSVYQNELGLLPEALSLLPSR